MTITYLLANSQRITKRHVVGKSSRRTINVATEDPTLADTPVSTIVESTNGVPLVVERAMWWPPGQWYGSHLSAGTTSTGKKWALAEGEVSDSPGCDTYILIANTSDAAGVATVTLALEGGTTVQRDVPLPAQSRVNVPVREVFPDVRNQRFAATIDAHGLDIVVERAMYSNAQGVLWATGTSSLGTKLP